MARENRSERRGRMRYGMCLNDQCPRCKSKEVQQIPPRKELVCEECGKPLRECPPPPTGPNKKMIIGIIIAILLCGGVGVGIYKLTHKEEPTTIEPQGGGKTGGGDDTGETGQGGETPNDPTGGDDENPQGGGGPTPPPPLTDPNEIKLSFGSYTGDQRDGYPHGTGTVTFTRQHTFKTSSGDQTVYPGETLTGKFYDGMLNHGNLIQRNDNKVPLMGIRIK